MIRFRTLGTISLTDGAKGGEHRSFLRQPKSVALLTYLALSRPRGFIRRDELLAVFWPESTQESARHALNQALYVLRQSLDREIIETRGEDEVRLAPDRFSCDAADLTDCVEAGEYAQALELYKGELLRGFHLSDNRLFEEWLEEQRRKTRQSAVDAAVSLAQNSTGSSIETARWLRRALELAPYDEGVLRELISTLAEAGELGLAASEYEAFAGRLAEHLDMMPSAETRELFDRVKRAAAVAAARDSSSRETAEGNVDRVASYEEPRSGGERPRAPLRRWRIGAAVTAALAALIVAVSLTVRDGSEAVPPAERSEIPEQRRVLVAAFNNETGDPDLDALGGLVADWIADGLAETEVVEIVTSSTAQLTVPPTGEFQLRDADELRALAAQSGAGTIVSGAYRQVGDSVLLRSQIVDAASGKVLFSVSEVSSPSTEPARNIEELTDRVVGGVASQTDPNLTSWATRAGNAPSYRAYREFSEGVALHVNTERDYEAALKRFYRAVELDTTFYEPWFWIGMAHARLGQVAEMEAANAWLERRRGRLSTYQRARLGTGDVLEDCRTSLSLFPTDDGNHFCGAILVGAFRPREAIEVLEELDPERGWLRGWQPSYWSSLTLAYHMLSEYERALEIVRNVNAEDLGGTEARLEKEVRQLAALGRVNEIEDLLQRVPPTLELTLDDWAPEALPQNAFGLFLIAGRELRAHGHADEARRLFEGALTWLESRPAEERSSVAWRNSYRMILADLDRWSDAAEVLRGLAAEPRSLWFGRDLDSIDPIAESFVEADLRGALGYAASQAGDVELAGETLVWLESLDPAAGEESAIHGQLVWRVLRWRAGIEMALGNEDRAVALFRQSLENNASTPSTPRAYRFLHTDPGPLGSHPRFLELMQPKD